MFYLEDGDHGDGHMALWYFMVFECIVMVLYGICKVLRNMCDINVESWY